MLPLVVRARSLTLDMLGGVVWTAALIASHQAVGRVLADMPGLLSRGALVAEQLDAITRDGLVLAPQTVANIGHAQARRNRWTAAALWTIALLLGWLIYLLIR